jgi:hypothetical protein
MGFFDNLNPFKKKDEFSLSPLDNPALPPAQGYGHDEMPNFGDGLSHDPMDGHSQPTFAAPDPRMNMPLGESIRQQRMETMHGNPDGYHEPPAHNPLQKDLELISSKLDYLKASLEAINQRIANLEHMARNQEGQKKW